MTDADCPARLGFVPGRTRPGRRAAMGSVPLAVTIATLLGLLLRIAAATGDLGLDEVWSLRLVARVHGLAEVFWGISHDNNHLLNSAWLYLAGQDRAIWIDRLPAILCGTLTVPATARLCGRRSPAAGAIAAVLAAVALPLVDFGSEARGYAGLILATVLAIDQGERAADAALAGDPAGCRAASWRLGAAVGVGALWHLTMAFTMVVLGLAIPMRFMLQGRGLGPALATTARILGPSAILALPAAAAVLAGILVRGTFAIGDTEPFTFAAMGQAYGGLLLLMSGLPDSVPGMAGAAGALVLIVIAARRGLLAPRSVPLAVAALLVLPAIAAAARLPNTGYCRYFWISGLVLLMLEAEALGTLWTRGGGARRLARALVLAMAAGSLALDALEVRDGRAGAGATLDLMWAEGAPTYAASHPVMAGMLLEDAGRRSGRSGVPVPAAAFCATPPDWFIAVGTYDPRPDGRVTVGPAACATTFRMRRPFPASPLSGTQWTLYRRG